MAFLLLLIIYTGKTLAIQQQSVYKISKKVWFHLKFKAICKHRKTAIQRPSTIETNKTMAVISPHW